MKRRRLLFFSVVAAIVLGAYAWHRFAPRETPPGQSPLAALDPTTFAGFVQAFNDSSGHTRLLVLLSPT